MTDRRTPYGVVHYGACRDDWPNLRLYDQPPAGGSPVKLQASALRAFRAAERRYAKLTGWSAQRIKRTGGRAIRLTGSWRSRAYQAQLYRRDPRRYAPPCSGLHPDGLAVDVSQDQPNLGKIDRVLKAEGWVQVRPSDEPWHYSYIVRG